MHRTEFHLCLDFIFFFFFSSRRRHTRFDCDWSSDVCSSDLCDNGASSSGLDFFSFAVPASDYLHSGLVTVGDVAKSTMSVPPGALTVSTSTTGADLDPDGYTVTVDGTQSQPIGDNASVTFPDVAA